MIEDDIENDLDAGAVDVSYHLAELIHGTNALGDRVRGLGCKVRQRLVTPVVDQSQLPQPVLRDRMLHRQQLDRSNAQAPQVLQYGL